MMPYSHFVSIHKSVIRCSRDTRPLAPKNRSWFSLWYNKIVRGRSYVQQLCDEYDSFEHLQKALGSMNVNGYNFEEKFIENNNLSTLKYIIFNPDFNKDNFFGHVYFRKS